MEQCIGTVGIKSKGKVKGAIAVVGLPHSGKSVFLSNIYKELNKRGIRFFVQRACPDGEGQWSAEAEQYVVKAIRKKGKFSKEFVDYQVKSISNLKKIFDIVLVDLGGLPSEENKQILQACDYYVALWREDMPEKVEEWKKLLSEVKVKPIAEFESKLENHCHIETNGVAKGIITGLKREGISEDTRQCIKKFVDWMLK